MTTTHPDSSVLALVARAKDGDQAAWNEIVERYAPLVWSTCVRHRLTGADAEDASAHVWLRLVERLGSIRDPQALPGWLATTTRNACLQLIRAKQRQVPVDGSRIPDETVAASDAWLLQHERNIALRTAFRDLSERCHELLSLLFQDPPADYTEISARTGMAIGSIGPTRRRCLEALRAHPQLAALDDRPDRITTGGRS